jgi:hypothetical protein
MQESFAQTPRFAEIPVIQYLGCKKGGEYGNTYPGRPRGIPM